MMRFLRQLFIRSYIEPHKRVVPEHDDPEEVHKLREAVKRHSEATMGVLKPTLDTLEDAGRLREQLDDVLQRIENPEKKRC